jgi:hypothetical protein
MENLSIESFLNKLYGFQYTLTFWALSRDFYDRFPILWTKSMRNHIIYKMASKYCSPFELEVKNRMKLEFDRLLGYFSGFLWQVPNFMNKIDEKSHYLCMVREKFEENKTSSKNIIFSIIYLTFLICLFGQTKES